MGFPSWTGIFRREMKINYYWYGFMHAQFRLSPPQFSPTLQITMTLLTILGFSLISILLQN